MSSDDFAWAEKLRSRWLRPNSCLYMRPDGARYLRPDGHRFLRPDHARFDPLDALVRKYSPDQPRVPAGNPDGGQWTSGGDGGNDADILSDASPDPIRPGAQYAADGHHYIPFGVFENKDYSFSPDVLKIFEDAKTGQLNDPSSNFYDHVHREYSDAVKEALDRYLERNKIQSSQMTPAQAREFVEEIKSSRDPRIRRFYNRMLYREWRFWFRRVPRGIN